MLLCLFLLVSVFSQEQNKTCMVPKGAVVSEKKKKVLCCPLLFKKIPPWHQKWVSAVWSAFEITHPLIFKSENVSVVWDDQESHDTVPIIIMLVKFIHMCVIVMVQIHSKSHHSLQTSPLFVCAQYLSMFVRESYLLLLCAVTKVYVTKYRKWQIFSKKTCLILKVLLCILWAIWALSYEI